MRGVRCVTFDLTGTLYEFCLPVGEMYALKAVEMGFKSYQDSALMKKSFGVAYRQALLENPCYGHDERVWWKALVRQSLSLYSQSVGHSVESSLESQELTFDRYFRSVYQVYGSREAFSVYPEVKDVLEGLRSRGLLIGVLTNSPLRTVDCTLPLLSLHRHFDFAVSCMDAGCEKPNKGIFDYSLRVVEQVCGSTVRPDEIVHVGNDPQLDFSGALDAGWRAVLVDRQSNVEKAHASSCGRSAVVRDLRELLSLIEDR